MVFHGRDPLIPSAIYARRAISIYAITSHDSLLISGLDEGSSVNISDSEPDPSLSTTVAHLVVVALSFTMDSEILGECGSVTVSPKVRDGTLGWVVEPWGSLDSSLCPSPA